MKLYIETRNKFLKISVIVLLISLVMILKFKINELGYFLLGIFASTLIIAIQSNMAAKVEESKLLIDKLKKMRDLCYGFDKFYTFSVEIFSVDFEDDFCKYKKQIEELFRVNNEIGNIQDLKNSTKQQIKNINDKIFELQSNLFLIFKNFDSASKKMKILYFMEFYKIIREFNFEKLQDLIIHLGWELDSKEFYSKDYSENIERRMREIEYNTSLAVYNKTVEQNNSIEYKTLKKEFERFMKDK